MILRDDGLPARFPLLLDLFCGAGEEICPNGTIPYDRANLPQWYDTVQEESSEWVKILPKTLG